MDTRKQGPACTPVPEKGPCLVRFQKAQRAGLSPMDGFYNMTRLLPIYFFQRASFRSFFKRLNIPIHFHSYINMKIFTYPKKIR